MAQEVKNLSAMQETQEMHIWSLGWEDPLEKEIETHSSILAWKIPKTEEPCGLQPKGLQRVRYKWAHIYNKQHIKIWGCNESKH